MCIYVSVILCVAVCDYVCVCPPVFVNEYMCCAMCRGVGAVNMLIAYAWDCIMWQGI